jgi:hypothetical protein
MEPQSPVKPRRDCFSFTRGAPPRQTAAPSSPLRWQKRAVASVPLALPSYTACRVTYISYRPMRRGEFIRLLFGTAVSCRLLRLAVRELDREGELDGLPIIPPDPRLSSNQPKCNKLAPDSAGFFFGRLSWRRPLSAAANSGATARAPCLSISLAPTLRR